MRIYDSGYQAECDFNRSGIVDSADLALASTVKGAFLAGTLSDPVIDNQIGYDGYVFNAETQQYHVRHRVYDPPLGRFIQRDHAGYVDGMSLYQYAMSSPAVYLDVLGREAARRDQMELRDPFSPGETFVTMNPYPLAWRHAGEVDALDRSIASLRRAGTGIEQRLGIARARLLLLDAQLHLLEAEGRLLAAAPWRMGLEQGASMVPLVGEGMDLAVIRDPCQPMWARVAAGGSLGVNVLTLGLLPNLGPMLRATVRELDNATTAARGADDLVDLASPARRRHILDGDATGGGHRAGTGAPGRSEFPASWSDDQIMHHISDIATDPAATRTPGRGGRTIVDGTRDGVNIRVVLDPDGSIVTGFPTNLPRNPR